jgi:hypothetical protein
MVQTPSPTGQHGIVVSTQITAGRLAANHVEGTAA